MPGNEVRGTAARADALRAFGHGCSYSGMSAQTQIVVAAKVDKLSTFYGGNYAIALFAESVDRSPRAA
jgi:hypothetical protein